MKTYMTVIGILLLLCGICCIATPLRDFVDIGYFLVILLMIYGIMCIVRGVESKTYGLNFVFGIISTVFGILFICIPAFRNLTLFTGLYVMSGWFIVKGVLTLIESIKAKKSDAGSMWILGVLAGVLGILMGAYSALHPLVLAFTEGWLISLYFIIAGLDTIAVSMGHKEK